jgi:hypothetical protein
VKYITVTLTEREARAVIYACGNLTMDIGDTPGDQGMKAACRAQLKIRRACGDDVSETATHWPYSGRYKDGLI